MGARKGDPGSAIFLKVPWKRPSLWMGMKRESRSSGEKGGSGGFPLQPSHQAWVPDFSPPLLCGFLTLFLLLPRPQLFLSVRWFLVSGLDLKGGNAGSEGGREEGPAWAVCSDKPGLGLGPYPATSCV